MFNFETVLIVMACSVPFLALTFVLPKFKKKEKSNPIKEEKSFQEGKKEEEKSEPHKEDLEENKTEIDSNADFSPEDFKKYLTNRNKSTIKPTRIELPEGFEDRTMPYIPQHRRKVEEKTKTVAEEIQQLSPTLKAMIIAGVLDKKDFN